MPQPHVRTYVRLLASAATLSAALACTSQENAATARTESASDIAARSINDSDSHRDDRVTLAPAAYQTAGIETATVSSQPLERAQESLEVPGQVEMDPLRVAAVSSRVAGRIERIRAVEGEVVNAGQEVASLYTPVFLTAQSDLSLTERRAQALAGTDDEAGAKALVEAARRRLRLMGASEDDILRLSAGAEPRAVLAIRAPQTGSIIEAHVMAGTAVEAGTPVFTVADLSVIDVVAEVPERSLPLVRVGQRATVRIAAYPSLKFSGEVERLRDALNPETRTVQAVIHVPNRGRRLRPGMFASVNLVVTGADALALAAPSDARSGGPLLTIPESALVTDGERRFVFVEVGSRSYERREVRVASLTPTGSALPRSMTVVVMDGLSAGERVVTRGAFTLKSELAKASLGDDHD